MQPLMAWQPVTMPPLPVSACWAAADGQVTVVPTFVVAQSVGSCAFRYEVNRNVLPELSARCSAVIFRAGRATPGLRALIAGSFQVLTLPAYIPARTLPPRFSGFLTPGRL